MDVCYINPYEQTAENWWYPEIEISPTLRDSFGPAIAEITPGVFYYLPGTTNLDSLQHETEVWRLTAGVDATFELVDVSTSSAIPWRRMYVGTAMSNQSATLYYYGGVDENAVASAELWALDVKTSVWSRLADGLFVGSAKNYLHYALAGYEDTLILVGEWQAYNPSSAIAIWSENSGWRAADVVVEVPGAVPLFRGACDWWHRSLMSKLLVCAGGSDKAITSQSGIQELNTNSFVWTESSLSLNYGRSWHTINIVGDLLYAYGGLPTTSELYILDLHTGLAITDVSVLRPAQRFMHASATVPGGFVIFGGNTLPIIAKDTWFYDVSSATWTLWPQAQSPPARVNTALATSSDGSRVYLFGGRSDLQSPPQAYYQDLWYLDLATQAWVSVVLDGSSVLPTARSNLAATFVQNKFVITGGSTNSILYDDCWVYDPITRTWIESKFENKPSITFPHVDHSLAADGDVVRFFFSSISSIFFFFVNPGVYVYSLFLGAAHTK